MFRAAVQNIQRGALTSYTSGPRALARWSQANPELTLCTPKFESVEEYRDMLEIIQPCIREAVKYVVEVYGGNSIASRR